MPPHHLLLHLIPPIHLENPTSMSQAGPSITPKEEWHSVYTFLPVRPVRPSSRQIPPHPIQIKCPRRRRQTSTRRGQGTELAVRRAEAHS